MDAGVAAVLAALITATGAIVAAMLASRHKQPDIPPPDETERGLKTHTLTGLPPLPPLDPYKSAVPSRSTFTTTVSPEPWTAPGVIGGHGATVRYAGFWVRLLAGLIDAVLVVFSFCATFVIFKFLFLRLAPGDEDAFGVFGGLTVMFVTLFLFYVLLPSIEAWQATPGKQACGLRLVRADGGRVTPLLAVKRFFSCVLSALPAGLGFLMIALDDEKRGLHDMICDTRVIYTP
jgi:uncharacterized RDD family membrane protein YckC